MEFLFIPGLSQAMAQYQFWKGIGEMEPYEIVFLIEDRITAELLNRAAYFSLVRYTRGGIDFEVLVPNDEIEFSREDDNDED